MLRELHRVLKPGGVGRIMVYNYDSVWLHLYVAYQKRLIEGLYADLDLIGAFAKTTDGENCPISVVYRPEEFIELCRQAGFDSSHRGAAVSMHEAKLVGQRFQAIEDIRLGPESRRFLLDLQFDDRGLPKYRGTYAGVDGCYFIRKP